jgi:O-antigen ligase
VSRREEDAKKLKSKNVSHTTPLTVGAELGTIGLLVYLGFLAALVRAILLTWRRQQALGLVLAGSLTALVVQSLFYGGFFEDPFVWGIAGVAAAALTLVPETAPAAARTERGAAAQRVDPLPARPPATPG